MVSKSQARLQQLDGYMAATVLQRTATLFEVTVGGLVGRKRDKRHARARSHAVRWLWEVGYTQAEIGKLLGGRDHSTVWWYLQHGKGEARRRDEGR